jgi:hypothetical protein
MQTPPSVTWVWDSAKLLLEMDSYYTIFKHDF